MIYLFNIAIVPFYYFCIKLLGLKRQITNNIFWAVFGIHAVLFRVLANPFNYVDTEGYATAFINISEMSFMEAVSSVYVLWGHGFVALNWIVSRISNEPFFFFSIISVISIAGVVWFYSRTSFTPFITSIFYATYPMLYLMGFGVIRQHLSLVFVLLALYYLDKKKYSLPLAIVACLIHTPSMIFLPFYFWRKIKFLKSSLFAFFIIAAIGVAIMRLITPFFLSFFTRYADTGLEEGGSTNIVPILILGSLTILFYKLNLNKRDLPGSDSYIIGFINYGFLIALFSFGIEAAGRLTLPFIYVFPTAISLLYKYSAKYKGIIYIYSLGIFLLVMLLLYASYEPGLYNYLFIWDSI